ncbi:hypothetical protein ScPMuIL_009551 [Solemya velum]
MLRPGKSKDQTRGNPSFGLRSLLLLSISLVSYSATDMQSGSFEFNSELKDKVEKQTDNFSSKFGLVSSCLGCVVGTGNIWRFPRIVASNSQEAGGLVFILVWVMFLALWSVPMLLIEYGVGRFTRRALIGSFRHFLGEKFAWCGAWMVMVSFFISCYYAVVLGWCFYYVFHTIGYELPEKAETSTQIFYDFAQDSYWPLLTHGMAVMIAGISVIQGVKTFEKVNMVLVPLFLIIIIFTFIWSLTRRYADYGIKFLFSPDWSSIGTARLWVDAISQNAFDTGAGSGLMITYATFMTREHAVVKYGTMTPLGNNFVSLICGIMIFATVFSTMIVAEPFFSRARIVEIMKNSGPASTGLTFIWIPVLFSSLGTFGRVLAVLFFLCLSFAGITSLISNMEQACHVLFDFGIPRKFGMPLTVLLTFGVGTASALNLDVLTNQDFVWGFALLVNGLMLQAMVIKFGVSRFRKEVINDFSLDDWKLPKFWNFFIWVICPLEAVVIIIWWAVDLIQTQSDNGVPWYEMGKETFMVTITQWLSVMLAVFLVNMVVWFWRTRRQHAETLTLLHNSYSHSLENSHIPRSLQEHKSLEKSVKDIVL